MRYYRPVGTIDILLVAASVLLCVFLSSNGNVFFLEVVFMFLVQKAGLFYIIGLVLRDQILVLQQFLIEMPDSMTLSNTTKL